MAVPKGTLSNVETGETVEFQFNPVEIKLALGADWKSSASPGASFERMQFGNRKNDVLTFKLQMDGRSRGAASVPDRLAYLASLTAPPDADLDIRTAAPPRVLVRFPGFLSMETILPDVGITAKRFDPTTGAPDYVDVDLKLVEFRTKRIGSETIRRLGFLRVAAGATGVGA
jgi:hypothetical protein